MIASINKTESRYFYWYYFSLIAVSFALSYIFYQWQKPVLFCTQGQGVGVGDAVGYIQLAQDLFVTGTGAVRTYGYPFILYFINLITPLKRIYAFHVLVWQFVMYVGAAYLVARSLTKNERFRLFIFASLLLNIYILSYLSVTLTEALSNCLLLISIAIFFGMRKSYFRVFLLGLVSAYAVEVRPANLWLFAFISLTFFWECLEEQKPREIFASLFIFGITALIVFLPQIYYNYHTFDKLTPFPAMSLGKLQYSWGKEATHVSFSFIPTAVANVFPNPFVTSSSHKFYWFSINGFSYLMLKILMIFSHYTLFVYQNISESFQKVIVLLSSFIVYFGFCGLILQYKNIDIKQRRAIIIGVFFCILLHIFSGLEDRFTFAIYLLLFPFALYQFWQLLRAKNLKLLLPFVAFFLYMNLMNAVYHALTPSYILSVQRGEIK